MKIHLFNSYASKIDFAEIFISIGAFILIADDVTLFANTGWTNLFSIDAESMSDDQVIDITRHLYRNNDEKRMELDLLDSEFNEIKKSKFQKHKDRITLLKIGLVRVAIKNLKEALIQDRYDFLVYGQLTEIFPFIEKKIWHVPIIDQLTASNNEDVFIKPLTESIIQREFIFGFNSIIEKHFTFTFLDSKDNDDSDFIKIPLWDIPFPDGFSFDKLKYTREDWHPALLQFKTHLKELSEVLFPISYIPENIARIKQLCQEKLNDQIAPVQQTIYDSLYIQQLMNRWPDIPKLKLWLGIASVETLIDYFEITTLVLPYVITQIKQQVSRHIDLKTSYVFTYFDIPHRIFKVENQEEKSE